GCDALVVHTDGLSDMGERTDNVPLLVDIGMGHRETRESVTGQVGDRGPVPGTGEDAKLRERALQEVDVEPGLNVICEGAKPMKMMLEGDDLPLASPDRSPPDLPTLAHEQIARP